MLTTLIIDRVKGKRTTFRLLAAASGVEVYRCYCRKEAFEKQQELLKQVVLAA